MTTSFIRYATEDGVATITIDHAPMNTMSFEMIEDVIRALDAADADDSVRAVILTGEGERAFCAGTDLSGRNFKQRAGDPATGENLELDQGGVLSLRLFEMNKLTIAAVNGAAAGIGASIVLPTDIKIASTTARFGFVFARRGIVPESCSSWFLPRVVGISTSLDWVLSGRLVSADEALAAGLVREIVAPDQLMARAGELARETISASAPLSVALSRKLLWRMLGAPDPYVATNFESRALRGLIGHVDMAEGVAAFKEKRPAQFVGKPSADIEFAKHWWPRGGA